MQNVNAFARTTISSSVACPASFEKVEGSKVMACSPYSCLVNGKDQGKTLVDENSLVNVRKLYVYAGHYELYQ